MSESGNEAARITREMAAGRDTQVAHGAPPARRRVGAYLHFPYCLKKCPYCDFTSFAKARDQIDHARYADAVLAELETRRGSIEGAELATIFVGGGTPSLWDPRELGRVLSAIRTSFASVDPDLEVTVECNPSSLDRERAKALLDAGANRLSIGVQSLDTRRLEFLGRLHDPDGGLRAIEDALSAGVPRVSGDLIFGVAGGSAQSAEDAAREVVRVAATGVTHLSAYGLTIEPGTQFGTEARRGRLPIAADETIVDSYFAVERELVARGFAHYEISNYAARDCESRHNIGYWRGLEYLGLGCGAVGALVEPDGVDARPSADCRARRYKNRTDPDGYVERALSRKNTEREEEWLDPEARLRERVMLGLRLEAGLDLDEAGAALGVSGWTKERERAAARLERVGRIARDGGQVWIPGPARVFTDAVVVELM
jgi:putative oxygen-independent coproporphyrinogen III oxidase